MNSLDELVRKLYEENLSIIAEKKNDTGLFPTFLDYMNKKYGKLSEKLKENPEVAEKVLDDWYQTELRHWGNLSEDEIYAKFVPDEVLLRIDEYSSKICNIASKKYESGLVDTEEKELASEYLQSIEEMVQRVNEDNKELVRKILSESKVEVDYICGKTKVISFRLANLYRVEKKEGF